MLRLFWTFILAAMLASCATVAPDIDAASAPDGSSGLLVGRSILLLNDSVVTGAEPYRVVSFLRPFASLSGLSRSPLVDGAISVPAKLSENGFFAVRLPPGKYYFDQFMYMGLKGPLPIGSRTYGRLPGVENTRTYALIVEVAAGRATYTGTIEHHLNGAPTTSSLSFGLKVVDETLLATQWLARRAPRWAPVLGTTVTAELEL